MRVIAIAALFLVAAAACDDPERPALPEATPAAVTPAPESARSPAATTAPSTATAPTPTPATAPTVTAQTPTPAPTASTPTPTPATVTPVAPGRVALTPAFGGREFSRPIELGTYPDGRLFVADQDGLVLLLDRDGGNERVLLDLSSKVRRAHNEEGLLSVALDPEFGSNRFLYAYYSASDPRRTVLSRFAVTADAADLASELVVLELAQPFGNHNGGAVRFGPDGMLYLGLGDGGLAGDPRGNGQDPSTLLGAIIRIDVRDISQERGYTVPPDNPLLELPGARPEVWAYGFRNPWRMAFDPDPGALWVADVGQGAVEEIDVVERGGNYGWNRLEGDDCFPPGAGCDAAGTVAPVATYRHDEGCSVTGGFVYRGAGVPAIAGAYVYADFCSGRVWALPADLSSGPVVVVESGRQVSSFGVDEDGELYLVAFGGPILRLTPLEP